jgi:hypothetical protein
MMRSFPILAVGAFLLTPDGAVAQQPYPFQAIFELDGGGHIFGYPPNPQVNGFDYFFTPLELDTDLSGTGVTIANVEVSAFGENNGSVVNWDWEVHLGPEPFGLPEGQFVETHVRPIIGYTRTAPTQLRIVIGSQFDTNSYPFSVNYSFTDHTIAVVPYLSQIKAAFTSPQDLPDGLYAQLFFWTGDNRICDITFGDATLVVRGTIEAIDAAGRVGLCHFGGHRDDTLLSSVPPTVAEAYCADMGGRYLRVPETALQGHFH